MNKLQSTLLRLIALLALMIGVSHSVQAATIIYGIRGTATAGANDIIQLDPTTGASTVVYDNYPGGNAATIAQCPNGLLYYSIFGGTNQIYVFNPQTPTVAPTVLGTGVADSSLRMACSPGGVLYYFDQSDTLRIINTATGAYSGAGVAITGAGAGGDISFNSGGTLYGFNNTSNLFTIPLGGGAVTQVGTGAVTGLNGAGIGLAFDASNGIRVLTNGGPGFYSVSTATNPPSATSLSTPPGGAATGDLASINVADPNLTITKTANILGVESGVATAVVYTIVVTNSSAYAVSGTVTDTFPAAVSGVAWTCAASGGSSCVASGSGNINTIATLAVGGTATYTVNATVNATAPVVNTANVALPFTFLTDSAPANNTATNTIRVRPSVTKSFGAASFAPGGTTSVTITIGNANGAPITTTAVFTDTLPVTPGAMTISPAGNTGTCTGVTATAGSGSITMANGTSIPAGGCTIIVSVTATALGTYNNMIAAGALSTSAGTNSTAASANVNVGAPPTVTKAFGAASFAPGNNTSVTITIGNTNGVAITTTGVFTDTLPVVPGAMTVNTTGSTGTCANVTANAGSGSITMANGTSIPAGGCTIIVSVTATALGTYNNTIAAGALVTNVGTNSSAASDTVDVIAAPPIITKSFSPASIASGGVSTLTFVLSNPSGVAMNNATFTDVFPTSPGAMTVAAPLTATNTCSAVGELRYPGNNALNAGDAGIRLRTGTIPANGSCTITVNVTASNVGVYINTIAVGDLTTSGGSNTVAANATLSVGMPSFTVAKTVSVISDPVNGGTTPKAIPGAIMQYSILVTNSGAGTATVNTTVITDPIPANTQLFVGNLGGPGSGPIAFVNGTPSSNLTYTFGGLGAGGDDVSFSNAGCAIFTYTPVPDINGFDAAVTCLRINPKGTFAAASGGNNPNFQARFRVRVN